MAIHALHLHEGGEEEPIWSLKTIKVLAGYGRQAKHMNLGDFAGRGDRIRTCDPLFPKQMRYQAAPLPEPEKRY